MKLKLNNREEEITSSETLLSVNDILHIKSFTYKDIIAIINGKIVHDEDYGIPQIKEFDDVMLMHVFGGG